MKKYRDMFYLGIVYYNILIDLIEFNGTYKTFCSRGTGSRDPLTSHAAGAFSGRRPGPHHDPPSAPTHSTPTSSSSRPKSETAAYSFSEAYRSRMSAGVPSVIYSLS